MKHLIMSLKTNNDYEKWTLQRVFSEGKSLFAENTGENRVTKTRIVSKRKYIFNIFLTDAKI